MIIIYFITIHCLLKAHCGQVPQLWFQHPSSKTLYIAENEFVNLTFWLNTSECKNPSGDYRMEVEIRRIDGSKEYDGKVALRNNLCSVTYENLVRCTGDRGPAELFRKVNRSHAEIAVIVRWKDEVSGRLKYKEWTVKLNVSYPQTATNHTVNGKDIHSERKMPLIEDNTGKENISTSVILWIAISTAVCFLGAIFVCRRRARRKTKAKCDTEVKTQEKRTSKQKIFSIFSNKQMSKNHNKYTACSDNTFLTVKTNESEDKISHHHQVLKQEEMFRLLEPESTMESELFASPRCTDVSLTLR